MEEVGHSQEGAQVFDCFRRWPVDDSRHLGLSRGPPLCGDIESEELHPRTEQLALRPLDEKVMFPQSAKNCCEFEEVLGRVVRRCTDQEIITFLHAVSCCDVFMEDFIH